MQFAAEVENDSRRVYCDTDHSVVFAESMEGLLVSTEPAQTLTW
jgi:hypothetical protein